MQYCSDTEAHLSNTLERYMNKMKTFRDREFLQLKDQTLVGVVSTVYAERMLVPGNRSGLASIPTRYVGSVDL